VEIRTYRDDDAALRRFAERNPGLVLLAEEDGHLVGSALGGWEAPGYRRETTVE